MMWYEILRPSFHLAHCAYFMSRWPLLNRWGNNRVIFSDCPCISAVKTLQIVLQNSVKVFSPVRAYPHNQTQFYFVGINGGPIGSCRLSREILQWCSEGLRVPWIALQPMMPRGISRAGMALLTEIFSKSYEMKPKSDCIYHFPSDLDPNGRPFGDQSVHGKYSLIY